MAQEQLDRMHQLVLVKNLLVGASGSKTVVINCRNIVITMVTYLVMIGGVKLTATRP